MNPQKIKVFQLHPGNGRVYEPILTDQAFKSLDDASRLLPQGAYTTFRTFNHTGILRFADHIIRLDDAARLAGVPVKVDWDWVRGALQQVLEQSSFPEARVRLTLDLKQQPGTVYLSVEPLKEPTKDEFEQGVKAITQRLQRENPHAKLTSFLKTAATVRRDAPKDVNEVIMVSGDGRILEGLSSNFFCVVDGEVWTAEEGVLPGITRTLVLEETLREGIVLHLEAFPADQVARIDEAFITSTSRSVLPVAQIDNRAIGSGKPGPITRRIMQAYQRRISEEIEAV